VTSSILVSILITTASKILELFTTLGHVYVNAKLCKIAKINCRVGTAILPANVYAKKRSNVIKINIGIILLAAVDAKNKLAALIPTIYKMPTPVSVSVLKFNVEILFNNKTLPHANVLVRRESVLGVSSKMPTPVSVSVLKFNVEILFNNKTLPHANVLVRRESVLGV
jgi:hypothetical protein